MMMAAPRRHPYAGVGIPMMHHHVPHHHSSMMGSMTHPSGPPPQLTPPPPPPVTQNGAPLMRQQSSPMYGAQPTMECHSPPVSRTYQYKKVTKPLLERKRRARINRCLDELKELMVGALEAEGENVSKLEKADILELTVRHLQRITRPRDAMEDASRFQAGFTQCATEACHFLLALPGLDVHVGSRLVAHLKQMVTEISTATAAAAASKVTSPSPPLVHGNNNNNNIITHPGGGGAQMPLRVSPPVSPQSTMTHNVPSKSEVVEEVDVESTEDEEEDIESPVNYTSAALRQRERKRKRSASESSSPEHHRCQDENRGPMWRPW